jgi:hypothetical protein
MVTWNILKNQFFYIQTLLLNIFFKSMHEVFFYIKYN